MRSRRGLGVLAVCGLVLGLMAISASGAQAGMWMVNGSNVGAGVELKVEAKVELEGSKATLLSTSGGNKVAITCTSTETSKAVVTLELITGTINFSGCSTQINEKASAECVPQEQPVKSGGTIHIALHEGKVYALLEGSGGVFATFHFTCAALPETVKVTGMGWLEDCLGEFEKENSVHLVQEAMAPVLALGGLKFGANAATIDGSANVKLIDAAHLNMPFSGLDK